MKLTLRYDNKKREVQIEGPNSNLNGLSLPFRNYVEDIKATYEEHMLRFREDGFEDGKIPIGKLEIELTIEQEEEK